MPELTDEQREEQLRDRLDFHVRGAMNRQDVEAVLRLLDDARRCAAAAEGRLQRVREFAQGYREGYLIFAALDAPEHPPIDFAGPGPLPRWARPGVDTHNGQPIGGCEQ